MLNIADRISVLRDGANVGTFSRGHIDEEAIVEAMLGRKLQAVEKRASTRGASVLCVSNLNIPGKVRNLSFELHRGEILGISGLSGSGKDVAIRGLYGLWPSRIERMEVNGKSVAIHHPSDGLSLGITYLAEERKNMSVFPQMTIRENASVLWLLAVWKRFVVNTKREREASLESIRRMNVKMAGPESPVDSLSGGNQRKLLLARLLMVKPDIVILNDPTRGVDVGSKQKNARINILAVQPTNWSSAEATKITEDYITRFKNMDAIFAHDDYIAGGVIVALKEAGIKPGQIKIVGVGGTGDALQAIKEGWMYGTVQQSPITEGEFEATRALEFLSTGKLDPFYAIMDNPKIDASNVHNYKAEF